MLLDGHLRSRLAVVLAVLSIVLVSGCAGKRELTRESGEPLILEYRMGENQVLKYRTSGEFTQTVDVRDQSVKVESRDVMLFSIRPMAREDDNYRLEVTIDSMAMNVSTPQGDLVPDMSGAVGESFGMTISPLGEELDISGADSIQYEFTPGSTRSVTSRFQTLFPDFPGRVAKIGDTWTSNDSIIEIASNGQIVIDAESVNRLEGFETVNGLKCAKVRSEFTGTLEGKTREGDVDLLTEGEIEGTDIWFFAYEEGVLVKVTTSGSAEGIITATGPQMMTIPLTREFKFETELIR